MKKLFFFILVILLLPFAVCSAEWFDGDVVKVDVNARELTISETDPITETEESEVISVVLSTVFSGVKDLNDVKTGDVVSIEAKYDEPSDTWQAVSIEVSGAGE